VDAVVEYVPGASAPVVVTTPVDEMCRYVVRPVWVYVTASDVPVVVIVALNEALDVS
jgi:hypothetical protein